MSHLTSKYKSTPTFTFKSKNNTITSYNKPQNIPSPVHYNVNRHELNKNTIPNGKFNQSSRVNKKIQSELPGPGMYETNCKSFIQSKSFHKGQLKERAERFQQKRDILPGPFQYKVKDITIKNQPKFSIGRSKSTHFQLKSEGPGPNSYTPKIQNQQSNASFSIGKQTRKLFQITKLSPGPGQYIEQRSFLSKSFNQNNTILSKARKLNTNVSLDNIPGPGAYKTVSFFEKNKLRSNKFSMQTRNIAPVIDAPGPGRYQRTSMDFQGSNKKGISLAKSQRQYLNDVLKRSSSLPSPGSYETQQYDHVKYKSTIASKFSKAKLPHLKESHEKSKSFINPQKLDVIYKKQPKFSIPSSLRENKSQSKIFQGKSYKFYDDNYNKLKYSKFQNSFSKQSKLKDQKANPNIGPGSYENQTNNIRLKANFSKQKRSTFLDKIIKQKIQTFNNQTFQNRQQFPNPPKYMNVYKKVSINQKKIHQY